MEFGKLVQHIQGVNRRMPTGTYTIVDVELLVPAGASRETCDLAYAYILYRSPSNRGI
jgi:hypothetical protein